MKVVHLCHFYNHLLRETLNESVNLRSKLPQNSVPIFISPNRIYFRMRKIQFVPRTPVYMEDYWRYIFVRKNNCQFKTLQTSFYKFRILFSSLSINLNLNFF